LRFAYLQHTEEITGTYKILLKWWVYTTYTPIFSPVIFPLYTAALVSLTAVHAFKIYRRYCENVQGITSAVQSSLSKATIARTHSSDLTAMARQHESQMLTVLATARRDKINATKVRVTDFFDIRARAWSSISTVKKPIERIVEGTKEVVDSTKTVDETEKPEDVDGLAQYLVEQAKLAQENAEKVDEELEVAQTAVTLAQKAIEDDEKARKAAKEEFNSASTALKNLQRSLTRVEAELLTISGHVEDTKGLAEKAVIIATEGDMEKADKAKVSAADAAESAEKGKTTLAERAKEVRSVLVGFLQSVEIPDTQTFGTV
jgi:chromosome segregation ATPase